MSKISTEEIIKKLSGDKHDVSLRYIPKHGRWIVKRELGESGESDDLLSLRGVFIGDTPQEAYEAYLKALKLDCIKEEETISLKCLIIISGDRHEYALSVKKKMWHQLDLQDKYRIVKDYVLGMNEVCIKWEEENE